MEKPIIVAERVSPAVSFRKGVAHKPSWEQCTLSYLTGSSSEPSLSDFNERRRYDGTFPYVKLYDQGSPLLRLNTAALTHNVRGHTQVIGTVRIFQPFHISCHKYSLSQFLSFVGSIFEMLCDICRRVLECWSDPNIVERVGPRHDEPSEGTQEKHEIEKYIYGHHHTKGSLKASVQSGRLICRGFERLDEDELSMLVKDKGFWSALTFSVFDDGIEVGFDLVLTYPWQPQRFELMKDVDKANWNFELSGNTDSPETWTLIEDWMSNCTTIHRRCCSTAESGFSPTRVLELDDTNGRTTYRLVGRSDCALKERYSALSYCWGSATAASKICLLDSTFESLQREADANTLPKTFRGAVRVTLRLGIRYLWIDSLCIYQDSEEDWRLESSNMRDVYRNSHLTISAVSGPDSSAGLFYQRNPKESTTEAVWLRLDALGNSSSLYRMKEDPRFLTIWEEDGITTHRGWCLQERLLSPRTIHFGERQIFWECREQCAAEVHPISIYQAIDWHGPDGPDPAQRHPLWKQMIGSMISAWSDSGERRLLDSWYGAMETYSECVLSFASDKLVAMSGLAEDMHRALSELTPQPYTYILGLWQEDLTRGLCWRQCLNMSARRPSSYRLPTWTWACMTGEICFEGIFQARIFPIIEQRDILVWGEGRELSLNLLGPILLVRVDEMSRTWSYYLIGLASTANPDTRLKCEWPFEADLDIRFYMDSDELDSEEVFLMPLIMNEDSKWWVKNEGTLRFSALIVSPVEGEPDVFRRVGLASTFTGWKFRERHLVEKSLEQFPKRRITLV